MHINEVKNKLIEWLDVLVYFKEKLIDVKSLFFQSLDSLEYELNVPEIEYYVDEIFTGEHIIAIMRNEMGVAWYGLHTEKTYCIDDIQKMLAIYNMEMKLLEEWQRKLWNNIEMLINKEIRLAS